MDKTNYRDKYKRGLTQLVKSEQAFVDFLKMASYQYKLPIHSIVQVYADNPTYQYLATYRDWNNFGRGVDGQQQSIDVFDSKQVLKLYNIDQTIINELKMVHDFSYINQATFKQLIQSTELTSVQLRAYCDKKLSLVDNSNKRYDLSFVSKASQLMLSQQLGMASSTEKDIAKLFRQFRVEGAPVKGIMSDIELAVQLVKSTIKDLVFVNYEQAKQKEIMIESPAFNTATKLILPQLKVEHLLDHTWYVLDDHEDIDWYEGEYYRIDNLDNAVPVELEIMEDKRNSRVFYRKKFESHDEPTDFNNQIDWSPVPDYVVISHHDNSINLLNQHNQLVASDVLISLNHEKVLGYQLKSDYTKVLQQTTLNKDKQDSLTLSTPIKKKTNLSKTDNNKPIVEQPKKEHLPAVKTVSLFDEFEDDAETVVPQPKVQSDLTPDTVRVDFTTDNLVYPTSNRDKIHANIQAIKLLNDLEDTQTMALPAEQVILAKYVGWGGLADIFDERKDVFLDERTELKSLVTEQEYLSMRESVLTAYYTSPIIIKEMYYALERMGFSGGRILDPAMGTGNFFSAMPIHIKDKSSLVGVELDSMTGKIAKHLQQTADIQIKGFETTQFESDSFDVVLGNIPFNNFNISDPSFDKSYVIHDYFFKKSLELVKDGGVIAFITSTGTLDKKSMTFRTELNEDADFLGAVRLPSNAFKEIAGTDVTTDIVFLQKNTMKLSQPENWLESIPDEDHEGVRYSSYYHDQPEKLLGEIEVKHFNGQTFSLKGDHNFPVVLNEQLQTIDGTISKMIEKRPQLKHEESTDISPSLDVEHMPMYTYFIDDKNNLVYRDMDNVSFTEVRTPATKRLKEAIELRQEVQKIIELQQSDYLMEEFEAQLIQLNQTYDSFVSKHGYLNTYRQQLQKDMYYPILLSIEEKNDNGTYSKASIMFEPTVRPQKQLDHADTALEAMNISLSERGKLDLDFMEHLYKKDQALMIDELDHRVFLDPSTDQWLTREEYLSGDVKDKLIMAKAKASDDPDCYQRNVEELLSVQPKPLTAGDIEVDIGSMWLPQDLYTDFVKDVFELSSYALNHQLKIEYESYRGSWSLTGTQQVHQGYMLTEKYGTKRANALRLLNDSLNLKKVEVYDSETVWEDGKNKPIRTLNPKETMLARSKQSDIHIAFKNWIYSDYDREQRIVDLYNDQFNRFVPRKYDGEHLEFGTLNKNYELRPHQKNVVSRITSEGRGLMAHVVGAGKTLSMISAGMKLKEQGTINKPMYVVPNHLVNEFALDIVKFYPTKNVLITTKKDFQKENRKQFVAKIASGNFDAVVIGHSQFEKIPLSVERQAEIIRRQIDEISSAIDEQNMKDGKSWSFKQMLRFEKSLKERLEKLLNGDKKDAHLTFEETGVDFLFVDEAHVYKNLYTYTKLSNVAGVNSSNSQRATDMQMKCEYLQEANGNFKGVVMATGTPISNSMSELYTMQRYLQPDMLAKLGCTKFDSWASTFGKITSSLEINPEGSGYQMKNRFSEFHNLPELMATFSEVADIQTSDMIKLPTPDIKTGKAQVVVTEPTDIQEALMEQFAERAESIRSGQVDPSEDNLLKLTHEAKLMAIDVRLLDDSYSSGEDSKLSACCDNVYEIWNKSADHSSTQLIFSDSGTPKKDKFNVYDEIKKQLMLKGIPENEIAFIHDAKNDNDKKELYTKVRSGDVRVLLGSTSKVGTGTNIQDKLLAVHHVDCPWRPSDVEQRNGRIVRQGNENKEVEIFQYVTKGTFDSFLWQTQENKLLYINQVMSGSALSRTSADLSETVLTAAEIKALATSNPFIAEKMSVDNDLNQLRLLKNQYLESRSDTQHKVKETYPNRIMALKQDIEAIESDCATYKKPDDFMIQLNGLSFDSRSEAGDYLASFVSQSKMMSFQTIEVGKYEEFELFVSRTSLNSFVLTIKGESEYKVDVNLDKGIGSIMRLENTLSKLSEMVEQKQTELDLLITDLEKMTCRMDEPFSKEAELADLQKRQHDLVLLIEEATLNKQANIALEQPSPIKETSIITSSANKQEQTPTQIMRL